MSSPAKEELPKIASDLKTELEQEHQLKPADTEEKVVLPSKEGKSRGVTNWFWSLTNSLISRTDIQVEKTQVELLKGIETFNPDESLKKAETVEKNSLPTKEEIEQEKSAPEEASS